MSRLSFRSRLAIATRELMPKRLTRAFDVLSGRAGDEFFKGAEVNRLLADWTSTLAHPDDETRWSLRRLRSRSRDLARNNPIVRQYLAQLTTNVIGPCGIQHQARVRDNSGKLNELINEKIEVAWEDWAYDPTIGGGLSLTRFEHLLLRSVATDGEVFVRIWRGYDNPYAFALEAIDADQVDEMYSRPARGGDEEIRMGIQVNQYGRPTGYWVWNKPAMILGQDTRRQREFIPADQIIHLYDPIRVNQSRGIPWLFPVMVALRMLDGYFEAELVAARTAASKMGFFERKEGMDSAMPEADEDGSVTMEANPGTFGFTPDGYTLKDWSPDHPSGAFGDFIKSGLRMVSSGLNVSYNSLANDLEGVNYSSMRSGLLIERDVWRSVQHWFIGSFRRPVYRNFLNMSLLSGALVLDSRDPRRFLEVNWSPRGWLWVDPLKDVQAAVMAINNGLGSRQQALSEQGIEFEDTLEQLKEEEDMAAEIGVNIKPAPTAVVPTEPAPSETPGGRGGERSGGVPGAADDAEFPAPRIRARQAILNGRSK